jgi:ankyrin repeat protein
LNRLIIATCCVIAAVVHLAAPLPAQAQKDSLAGLIQSGNRKAALERIRAGADVNEAQPDGTRPIHWAIYRVDYELLDALLAKHAQVNIANEFGATPVAEAAGLGDARMVRALLAAGAEPEGVNEDGQTALMLAVKTGELPVVEMLVKAGANVNAVEKFHNQTPLMWAATAPKNAGAIVKLLLSKDASVKPRSLYSDWPSQITSEPRAQYRPTGGFTALLYAARDGCDECVDALLGAGANPDIPTPEGVTALMEALDNDHTDVAKLLLNRGANPALWDWWGRTALYIVIDRKEGGSSGGLRLGLNAIGGGRGAAPAARAGSTSQMEIINMLLAAGVDPQPQLNMHRPSRGGNSGRFIDPLLSTGCTPLLRATMGGDMEVIQALLAKGASPNVNAMGLTPFLVAAGVGAGNRGGTGLAAQSSAGIAANQAIMDVLLQHGADVNTQVTGTKTYSMRISRAPSANEGMTALHVAAQDGKLEQVRYLLAKGASTEIVDASGRKPIDLVGARTAGNQPAPAGSANAATSAAPAAEVTPAGPAPRGGRGGAANADEIRGLLASAGSKK